MAFYTLQVKAVEGLLHTSFREIWGETTCFPILADDGNYNE